MRRNYIGLSQLLEWYQELFYDDSQSNNSKFSVPTKQFHVWKVQLHFTLGMCPHPSALSLLDCSLDCFVSLLVMVQHLLCHPGSKSGSHSPLLFSSPKSSQPLCPGISSSALPLLFVLVLPKSTPQYRCYCKIVASLIPHL